MAAFGPLQPFESSRLLATCARRGRRYPPGAHAVAVCASLRLHCAARSGVAPQNSLRSLRSLRSNSRGESDNEPRWRAPTPAQRCSSPQKSPPPSTACRSGTDGVLRPNTTDVVAKARPGRLRSASEAPSSAGRVARARSAHQQLTCRRLFERSERSERSEFGDGPRDRAAQGSLSEAKTAEAKRSSLPGCAFAAPTAARKSALRTAATGRKQTPNFMRRGSRVPRWGN